MPLIIGSQRASKGLQELVHKKDDGEIVKLTKRVEVEAVRNWLEKQPHLPEVSDEQIVVFLHSCFYSIERTKDTIDNYYTFRTHAPELYTKRNYKTDVFKSLKVIHLAVIPPQHKTPEGYQMVVMRLRDSDPSKFDFQEAITAGIAMLDYVIGSNPLSEGVRAVFDMKDIQLMHVTKISLSVLRKVMMFIQEAMPARLRGIHVLNTFPLINQILALVKPLMKQELLEMFYLHSPNELQDFKDRFVPNYMMPSDYGGELKSVEYYHSEVVKNLQDHGAEWLEELETYRVDEKRRTGKPRRASDVYGMEGSFKKLDLD